MKRVIIQGSSRSNGNTSKIVDKLKDYIIFDTIELHPRDIRQYDYARKYSDDDFMVVMRQLVTYDLIIFATPVYWYAMSGLMKTFFDRITDCLKIEKTTGRKLRGKLMAALSCGSDAMEVPGFFQPFALSADYLGMKYVGDLHTWVEENQVPPDVEVLVKQFAEKLK